LRSGTFAIVRTPTPGGMRTHRSGAITPRRAACARSKRDVCVGKRSVTWRAMRAPVAVMPMNTGPCQLRIAALVFSPSAVCASSQMTIVYASETLPALRTNHW
jgi:hypothetical protein